MSVEVCVDDMVLALRPNCTAVFYSHVPTSLRFIRSSIHADSSIFRPITSTAVTECVLFLSVVLSFEKRLLICFKYPGAVSFDGANASA
jgi:hypothetical protein